MVDHTAGLHNPSELKKSTNMSVLNSKQRNWILAIGLLATFLPLLLIEAGVLRYTGGVFMYPVDDTFIHMEVARNLAFHGNWGVNSHEFSSASSSLLYTLILAILFKLFSVHTIFPFLVNCVAAIALLVVLSNWLARQQLATWSVVLILLAVIGLTPLPIIVMSGMEHTLQCLFSFLFLIKSANWIQSNKDNKQEKIPWSVPLYGLLVVACRYEGLFLVFVVCLSFLYLKKYWAAVKTGVIALLPVLIFGLYSVYKGSYFLPNSVLIKSDEVPLFGGGFSHFIETLLVEKLTLSKPGITALATQRLLLILPLTFLLFRNFLKEKVSYSWALLVLTITTLLHLSFASTGKFYRYEAYLILCAVVYTGTVMMKYTGALFDKKKPAVVLLAVMAFFFLCFPLVLRSTAAFSKAGQACINIYEQQFQMGRFLQQYYPGETVAANDIGAVSFFSGGNIIDLWGLGSIEIARSRKNGYWNPVYLDSLVRQRHTKLAMIYDSWFNNGFAGHWKKLASWQIHNNVVCGDDFVSFYAIEGADAPVIKEHLLQFETSLPHSISVRYY